MSEKVELKFRFDSVPQVDYEYQRFPFHPYQWNPNLQEQTLQDLHSHWNKWEHNRVHHHPLAKEYKHNRVRGK